MTQKDNVKQLIGKSLNAYNNKVLQQIDRIEKKNKQQNHKISMLTNELDNDYLTKTEEGSVISLEHSKEGMVYLDEIQGNTLVNYCTDGSKEMTLNGDIDLEGTFVTTTEGVDGGKVDVMCEGNTLVNLKLNSGEKCGVSWQNSNTVNYFTLSENSSIHLKGEIIETSNVLQFGWCYAKLGKFNTKLLKPNTTYTIILDNHYDWLRVFSLMEGNATNAYHKSGAKISKNIYTVTTKDNFEGLNDEHIILYGSIDGNYKGNVDCSVVAMLEGDWSNKELPNVFFEGMKSVGQDNVNGHKIEILSQSSYPNLIKKSKNLSGNRTGSDTSNNNGVQYLREDNVEFARVSANKQDFSNFYWWLQTVEPRKKGETYTISYDYRCTSDWSGYWYPSESYSGSFFPSTNGEWRRMKITRTVTGGVTKENMLFGVFIRSVEIGDYIDIKNVKMEKGTNNSKWIPSVMDEEFLLAEYSNKKEILMNEPLRKANDFYRDRLVKIGNKCYIERNTKEVVLDGTHNVVISDTSVKDETLCRFDFTINGLIKGSNGGEDKKFICDKLPYLFIHALAGGSTNVAQECISNHSTNENSLNMVIKKSRLETIDVTGVNKWLSNNNIKIIIPIATPIYEPLEINPELLIYTDVTHISNNSLIPCSMKVQNSGYNAIIKPSTLYTVALDTNKSGTIGMNLGGVKGTTTNNVLKLTTPATLTDDSLRLYGKGIKGSKVRLLEGDKTNWMPSHFEGMKSCFEDKVQDDGSYGIEIVSNNENLFDINKRINKSSKYWWVIPKLKANKMSFKFNTSIPYIEFYESNIDNIYNIYTNWTVNSTFTNVSQGTTVAYKTDKPYVIMAFDLATAPSEEVMKSLQVVDGDKIPTDYTPQITNKIQFSSIEPLRGVGNIKDKFVFKDGKLMIERNIGQRIYNGTENWGLYSNKDKVYWISIDEPDGIRGDVGVNRNCYTNKFTRVGSVTFDQEGWSWGDNSPRFYISLSKFKMSEISTNGAKQVLQQWHREGSPLTVTYVKAKPIYEEIPFELQKIILEGYENGTLFFDTNIPPTSTVTYAGETPIVKSVRLNKTEVLNNTNDINDNIIPYLMDMDYRVVCLQLQSDMVNISMARLFGGVYVMLKRDILSKRYSVEEYKYRLDAYLSVNKITEKEYEELGEMLNE